MSAILGGFLIYALILSPAADMANELVKKIRKAVVSRRTA